jgi:putative redox protein
MEREVVVRTVEGGGPFADSIAVGPHRLSADEPAGAGGGDAGPAPFELLMAALGACTSMTLRGYAARKGWVLRSVEVRLTRVRGEPGAKPENEIRRTLRMEGDLDGDQRKRLLEIAEKCPVHRALTAGTPVKSTLA